MTARLTIAAGDYEAQLLPEAGGSIASFRWKHPENGWLDLMRPAPIGLDKPKPIETACFPLVPFANRIRDGRFTFRGRTVQFPASAIGKHYLHGTSWLRPWAVAKASQDSVLLTQVHEPDSWPYAFETSQEFLLDAKGLTVVMRTTNRSSKPMPFGFGLHPYFPRTPKCRLEAEVTGWWEADAEIMPTEHTSVRPDIDPRQSLIISDVVCDNAFSGWNGTAVIAWPEHATQLTMTAPPQFGVLFLYVPPSLDHFCVEPNSHFADAFNLAAAGHASTGMMVLEPGQKAEAAIGFRASVRH